MNIITKSESQQESSAGKSTPLYPISIASKLTNTTVYTLRVYEDRGLILPYRTSTGRRLYSDTDIARLHCIRKQIDEQGLNMAGIRSLMAIIPCWLLKQCAPEDRMECGAYQSPSDPCWQASDKSPACRNEDCRSCSVYHIPERYDDVKSLYKELLDSPSFEE